MRRYLPMTDLEGYRAQDLGSDLSAALAVTFMAIPQGVAYAMIAGLPPAMGLYAAAAPAVVASLFRSSRHMVTGPTNAVSLIVGTAIASGIDAPPEVVGVTLALMVGLLQIAAGFLRLSAIVDYISGAVVLGFITGAALLIGLGQLSHVTATSEGEGLIGPRLGEWIRGLWQADPVSVGLALGTGALILLLPRVHRRIPAALVSLALATALTMGLHLDVATVNSLAPIDAALPPLTMPDTDLFRLLLPLAVAVTVLCMVESTSMSRALARRTRQRLDISVEFTGEGLANVVGSFLGAYPVTGSLSRSAVNEREGARTRLAGVFSGLMVLLAPLGLAPFLDSVPIAALAGMLLVVAAKLVDVEHIRKTLRSHNGDRVAFVGTLVGTFALPLDKAIYLGVALSIINFLRRARLLRLRDLVIDDDGRLREVAVRARRCGEQGFHQEGAHYCRAIHAINVSGSLFFAATAELQAAFDVVLRNPRIKVLVVRLKRVQDMDVSTLDLLEANAEQLQASGRLLVLVGMGTGTTRFMERIGTTERVGAENMFPSDRSHWFAAFESATQRALSFVGRDHGCEGPCPYDRWLQGRDLS